MTALPARELSAQFPGDDQGGEGSQREQVGSELAAAGREEEQAGHETGGGVAGGAVAGVPGCGDDAEQSAGQWYQPRQERDTDDRQVVPEGLNVGRTLEVTLDRLDAERLEDRARADAGDQ